MVTKLNKVLFIQPSLDAVGGIEKVIPTVAVGLHNLGVTVSTINFYGKIPVEQYFWSNSYTVNESETRGYTDKILKVWHRLFFLRRKALEINPDITVVSAQGASIITLLAKKIGFIKSPVLLYVHEVFIASNWLYVFLMKRLYKKADGFIFVSKGLKQNYSAYINIDKPSIVAYNAAPSVEIESSDFDFSRHPKPWFINASRIEKIKGSDALIDAYIEYSKNNDGTLFVLGAGSILNDLKNKVYEAGFSDRIVFLGFRKDVIALVALCDVYVSCSRLEGFPVSMLETMSVKTPILFTDAPFGPREMMDVDMDDDLNYPYANKYGVLFSEVDTALGNKDLFNERFSEGLQHVVTKGKTFYSDNLSDRSRYFSENNQVRSIYDFLSKLS